MNYLSFLKLALDLTDIYVSLDFCVSMCSDKGGSSSSRKNLWEAYLCLGVYPVSLLNDGETAILKECGEVDMRLSFEAKTSLQLKMMTFLKAINSLLSTSIPLCPLPYSTKSNS